jgi:outer membrane receptor protein involved in Fe transport
MTALGSIEIPYGFFGNIVSGSLKMGAKVYDKKRETYQNQFFERLYQSNDHWDEFERHNTRYGTPGFVWKTLSYSNMPSFLNYMDANYNAGKFLNGDYDFGVGLDREELLHLANTYLIDSLYTQDELQGLEDFDMNERISAAYIMTEIKIGEWLTFLPGVRYEQTWIEMKSKSSNVQPADIIRRGSTSDTTATHTYGNWFHVPLAYQTGGLLTSDLPKLRLFPSAHGKINPRPESLHKPSDAGGST